MRRAGGITVMRAATATSRKARRRITARRRWPRRPSSRPILSASASRAARFAVPSTMPIRIASGALAFLLLTAATTAQDVRGIEVCTAEKQMERRTGCLQANIELLHQLLVKLARENNAKIDAANRDLAAARGEIAALKAALAKLEGDVAALKRKESK